jgi:hypothetical protein
VLVLLGAIMNHELMAAMRRSLQWRNFEKSERLLLLIIAVRYFERERGRKEKGSRVISQILSSLDDGMNTQEHRTTRHTEHHNNLSLFTTQAS